MCVYVCVYEGKFPLDWLEEKNRYIIYRALCTMKVWGPLFKIIGNFKMATGEHQTKLGPF